MKAFAIVARSIMQILSAEEGNDLSGRMGKYAGLVH